MKTKITEKILQNFGATLIDFRAERLGQQLGDFIAFEGLVNLLEYEDFKILQDAKELLLEMAKKAGKPLKVVAEKEKIEHLKEKLENEVQRADELCDKLDQANKTIDEMLVNKEVEQ